MATIVKPYSKKELCVMYGVTYTTLRKWLSPHAKVIGPYVVRYRPAQIKIIFELLGIPNQELAA